MGEKVDGRKTEAFREASRARAKRMMEDPKLREAARERMKVRNANPEFRAATGTRISALMHERYKDKEVRANQTKKARAVLAERMKAPAFSAYARAVSRHNIEKLNTDPTFRKARADRMRALHKDPVFSAATAARLKAAREKRTTTEFRIPKGLENEYRKLRRSLGVERARKELQARIKTDLPQ